MELKTIEVKYTAIDEQCLKCELFKPAESETGTKYCENLAICLNALTLREPTIEPKKQDISPCIMCSDLAKCQKPCEMQLEYLRRNGVKV